LRRYSASVIEQVSPVPLTEVKTGVITRIMSVVAGHELRERLHVMGLVIGESIEVLQNARRGPVIVAVCGCRIVPGRRLADKILVE